MNTLTRFIFSICISLLLVISLSKHSMAQLNQDSTKGIKIIKLLHADSLIGSKPNGVEYNKLIGNVSLEHDGNILTCDSAYLYLAKNYVETFGNSHIVASNGADIQAEKIIYNGNTNNINLINDVSIIDKENTLQGKLGTYNLKTKVATYSEGGTLQNGSTTITSNKGNYNGFSKIAQFDGNVVITDAKYNIEGESIKYNTVKKIIYFQREAIIHANETTITGKNGYYNTITESGNFKSRTLVQTPDNDIEANTLTYNKQSGESSANGDVSINDYKNETVIYANKVDNNDKTGIVNAYGNVQITDIKNQKEIFASKVRNNKTSNEFLASGNVHIIDMENNREIWASTVINNSNTGAAKATDKVIINDFSEHRLLKADNIIYNDKHKYMSASGKVEMQDSTNNNIIYCKQAITNQNINYTLLLGRPLIKSLNGTDSLFMKADSFFIAPTYICDTISLFYVPEFISGDSLLQDNSDTTRQTIMGIGNVKIFADSMQAICDSFTYNQRDSIYRLYNEPLMWARGTQAKGDSIVATTANNKINKLYLNTNASIINHTGDSTLYNQVSGVHIVANIADDALQDLDVLENAKSIYFRKDDELQAYEGMVNVKSTSMRVLMKDKEVNRIIMYTLPEGVFYPMKDIKQSNAFLDTYIWLDSKRPKSKIDLD